MTEKLVIYNRKTGEIVKSMDVPSARKFSAFISYANMQIDKKNFGWKIQDSRLKSVKLRKVS